MTERGRTSRWEELDMPNKLDLIEEWAGDGATDKIIADKLGIGLTTLYDWKNKYPEFVEALKRGKEIVDEKVENALLKNALGFTFTEQTVTNKGDIVEIEKQSAPNTAAQIFWLKNRKAKEWRDKQNIEHSGTMVQQHVDLSHLSDVELAELVKKNKLD